MPAGEGRIGILTGGGDAPGLNAVIRSVVKAAGQSGIEVVGFEQGYEGLLPPAAYRVLNDANTRGIHHLGGTILGATNRGRFGATAGQGGKRRIASKVLEDARASCEALDIRGLVCIGGDGSLRIAQQLFLAGVPVVGVPKTIDNDLEATAISFGFDSAVAFATEALDRLHPTAAAHQRVMVVEVMGRHTGWIAVHAGIAGGADVILIPEIPWSFDGIVRKIRERERSGRPFALIVAAEGARLPDGALVAKATGAGGFGKVRLGGIGQLVAEEAQRLTRRESRSVVLGHLQRGGPPTTFDRVLATRLGVHAVRLIQQGRFGRMVASQPPTTTDVPIVNAINRLRTVPPDGDLVGAARALGISFGDS